MTFRNIGLIFRREVADQLRDRRTLFMIAVLPVLLYPALGIGTLEMALLFTEQPRTVVILGADQLPAPPLLDGSQFSGRWFANPDDAAKLVVISDRAADSTIAETNEAPLRAARELERLLAERDKLPRANPELDPQRAEIRDRMAALFHKSGFQVLLIVPENFRAHLDEWQRTLKERTASESLSNFPKPVVVQNSADDKSRIAFMRVTEALRRWEQAISQRELQEAGLPENLPKPIDPEEVDLATMQQQAGNFWSVFFPAILVIMLLTGAFYPAIDLCAGEKERGTMETLLICPATRTEIVIGKFLTVLLFSVTTALLNLCSMGFTGRYMASFPSGGTMSKFGDMSLPSLSALIWVCVMLVPLSAMFSALCLSFATFARSSKEGQYYLTPLLMVTMGLVVFCVMPGTELNPFYGVMPVMGPALLMKGLLKSQGMTVELLPYVVPVLTTSLFYSVLALWWAIDQFASEDVLFREAERFDLRLWVRHLLRDKEPAPTFSEAVFCFVLIMLLQFAALKVMQVPLQHVDESGRTVLLLQTLIVQQLAIIATPALFMGVMLVSDLRKTFLLHLPRIGHLLAAGILAVCLQPLSSALGQAMDWFFPPLPKELLERLSAMTSGDVPIWLVVLAFAAAPALCEEIAFRGFILSGLRRTGRTTLAIVLSSLLFGIMHLIPQQVFNAALVGLVLGYIAVKTDSLLPGIFFHFCYNGLEVLRFRYGTHVPTNGVWSLLFSRTDEGLRYEPVLLILCGTVAAFLLAYLKLGPRRVNPPFDAATTLLTSRSVPTR